MDGHAGLGPFPHLPGMVRSDPAFTGSADRCSASLEPLPLRCPAATHAEPPAAVNDDEAADDVALLRSALRLAEQRGAAAARFAHAQAEKAYFAGGGAPYRWWLAVTRVLDRMLAAEFGIGPADEAQPQG
jgi:hypothetical protein